MPTNGNRYATWALLESHVPRKFGLGCTSNRDSLKIVVGDFCPIERDPIFCEDFSRPMNPNGFHPTEYVRPGGFYTAVERGWISWQIDHTVPLWSIDRTRPWTEIIKFWGLTNLAALCEPCHKAKTAREAADRARRRRGTQELALCVGAPA